LFIRESNIILKLEINLIWWIYRSKIQLMGISPKLKFYSNSSLWNVKINYLFLGLLEKIIKWELNGGLWE